MSCDLKLNFLLTALKTHSVINGTVFYKRTHRSRHSRSKEGLEPYVLQYVVSTRCVCCLLSVDCRYCTSVICTSTWFSILWNVFEGRRKAVERKSRRYGHSCGPECHPRHRARFWRTRISKMHTWKLGLCSTPGLHPTEPSYTYCIYGEGDPMRELNIQEQENKYYDLKWRWTPVLLAFKHVWGHLLVRKYVRTVVRTNLCANIIYYLFHQESRTIRGNVDWCVNM